jgi:hypothetical protein
MTAATISHVEIAAAHDGEAELVVTLSFENGGRSQVTLDEYGARQLLDSCAASNADDLIGASWEKVRDALVASSSRYAGT